MLALFTQGVKTIVPTRSQSESPSWIKFMTVWK